MRVVKVLVCLLLVITISGCNKKAKNDVVSNSNSNIVMEKEVDIYKVDFKNKSIDINDSVSAKYNICNIDSSTKKEESKLIEKYLNDKVNNLFNEFKEVVNNQYIKNSSYIFDYQYSLFSQNEKYIIFKLKYTIQSGEPHSIDGTEYYMFNINTGKIVEFDDLFTEDIKDKVYNSVLNNINNMYKESEMKYNPTEYDLNTNMFFPGYYVLNNNKLLFSFPTSTFTISAFGTIEIDIDSSTYNKYIK